MLIEEYFYWLFKVHSSTGFRKRSKNIIYVYLRLTVRRCLLNKSIKTSSFHFLGHKMR